MHARIIAFLERRPALRWLLYAVLGIGIFMIGASYLRLQSRPDPIAFQLTGGDLLARGWPATLRVRARTAHRSLAYPVTVERVTLGEVALTHETTGSDPTALQFTVPDTVTGETLSATLKLTLRAGETTETITVPIAVTGQDPESETRPSAAAPLVETKRSMRVDLYPDAGELVSNMANRVFVRARRLDGSPIAGATITVSHSTFPNGQQAVVTDTTGLGTIHITPRLPNLDVRITAVASEADAVQETFNTTLYAVGRQLAFEDIPALIAQHKATTVTVRTTRDSVDLYCDLLRGRQHIAGYRLPIPTSRIVEVQLPAFDRDGRYDLQCYFNLLIPGSTFAARAFWVGPTDNFAQLSLAAERSGYFAGESLSVPANVTALTFPNYAAYLASRLSERSVRSTMLAQTFDTAVVAADEKWSGEKDLALFALIAAIALVLLVGLDLVISNILSNRRRFRAYEADLAEDGALADITLDGVDLAANHSTQRLDRTRGWLFIIVVVGTLFANVVGFLMLSGMFRT